MFSVGDNVRNKITGQIGTIVRLKVLGITSIVVKFSNDATRPDILHVYFGNDSNSFEKINN